METVKIPVYGTAHRRHVMMTLQRAEQLRQLMREHPSPLFNRKVQAALELFWRTSPFDDEIKAEKKAAFRNRFGREPQDEREVYQLLELPAKKKFNEQYFKQLTDGQFDGIPARQAIDRAAGRVSLDTETVTGRLLGHEPAMMIIHDETLPLGMDLGKVEARIMKALTGKPAKKPSLLTAARNARNAAIALRKAEAACARARKALTDANLNVNKARTVDNKAQILLHEAVNS